MYKALYDYKTDLKQYLSFQTGDQFTILDTSQKDWFYAQNGFGEIGYIPKNYVVRDEGSQNEVLQSIDRAIEVIHYEASSKGGQYTHTQRENLRKLIEHRENVVGTANHNTATSSGNSATVEAKSSKRQSARRTAQAAPSDHQPANTVHHSPCAEPSHSNTANNTQPEATISTQNHRTNVSQSINNAASISNHKAASSMLPQPIITKTDSATSPFPSPAKTKSQKSESCIIDCQTVPIPDQLGNDLVEEVRKNTGLSYRKSCIAVGTVLGHIGLHVSDASELMDRIYKTMAKPETEEEVLVAGSSDHERLCELFEKLTECKDDSQQRGWALHEDEQIITESLDEMLSILENANPAVAKNALAVDSYENVHNLVQYYQLENRVKLRLLLLRVFGAMCTLDSTVITLLLCSVLVTELADELQHNISDVQRCSYVTLMLCMLFSTGESVPANLHDHLNATFLTFVLDTIETPPSYEHEDQITDLLINFVLAFNLHLKHPKDNLVLQAIEDRQTVKVFTEKLLLLFNRDEDPVPMFDHEPKPENAVLKILQDMYSRKETSFILYTNDAKVLIDIILRHLIDLSPGEEQRTCHLKLMRLYLENADYMEHQHRHGELQTCLQRIAHEEEDTGDDKHIAKYILTHILS